MMASSVDGELDLAYDFGLDMDALIGTSEQPTNGQEFTVEDLKRLGFDAVMIAWCMEDIPSPPTPVEEEVEVAEAAPAELEAAIPQRFQLTRVPGTETFDLDFLMEIRLEDLMALTVPCVLTRLSNSALARLFYEYHKCGAQLGITVVGRRDFHFDTLMKQLNATQGVVDNVMAHQLFSTLSLTAFNVAEHIATVTCNHNQGLAHDFLEIYHGYSTGGEMLDEIIQACEALLPRIQKIGYIAFSNAVIARMMDNHEQQVEARNGKKKARDDDLEGITMMKCIMDDILNRVERMYDRRGLREFTYMDSCRVTFGIFHVGLRRWAASGFTSPYPDMLKLRTVDLDPQMVRFHRALFQGPQFEHLEMDMYTAADIHLATSCVYFNFCSIGGIDGVMRFKTWYMAKLAQGVSNCDMPLISFTVRGMGRKPWRLMTSDHLMRMCSMRGCFLTFEPTRESDDGMQLVWLSQDSKKPKNAGTVRVLNSNYDAAQVLHSTNLVPKFGKVAGKTKKAQTEKAKIARKAARDAKL